GVGGGAPRPARAGDRDDAHGARRRERPAPRAAARGAQRRGGRAGRDARERQAADDARRAALERRAGRPARAPRDPGRAGRRGPRGGPGRGRRRARARRGARRGPAGRARRSAGRRAPGRGTTGPSPRPPRGGRMTASAGFYLAVMPRYRRACVEIVRQTWLGELAVWVSDAHLDPSVRTDPDVGWYRRVRMVRVRRAAFLQVGHWRDALRRGTTVVDLNPRSLTAWLLLVLRRASGRRVLVWGHVHPRAGQGARTAPVRRLMRRLAHGTVSYTVADAADARADLPGSPVWVATNALYRRDDIRVPAGDEVGERDHLVFVGRFVRAKKVDLLVRAFAVARQARPGMRLTLVGDGELRPELERFVREQGLQDAVTFAGWVDDVDALR